MLTEQQVIELIKEQLGQLFGSDRYLFTKTLQLFDGRNILLGTGTGTKIGTAATQKLSVFGVTPVIQASAISAPSAPGGIYSQAEAASAVTAINSIRTAIKNFGITA